jgi:hypothetical protein
MESYIYEDCKSKPYVEPKIEQDELAIIVLRQIHEVSNDLNTITTAYDRETEALRQMMVERGDEFRKYMDKHQAAYYVVTDQMDSIQKEVYGDQLFEQLGFGLAKIDYMVKEFRLNEKKAELGLHVEPEVEHENQMSLTEIQAMSDKDKREHGYPVFSNVDTEKHERIFEKRSALEKEKQERQIEKSVERSY